MSSRPRRGRPDLYCEAGPPAPVDRRAPTLAEATDVVFPDAVAVGARHPVGVSLFVVERYLAGWTPDEVRDLLTRTAGLAQDLAPTGVHHLGSVLIPGDETCLCLFEGPDLDVVRDVNARHHLPFGRVVAGELSGAVSRAGTDIRR